MPKPIPTPSSIMATINGMYSLRMQQLFSLYERWQDERKHEDFADYEKLMRSWLPPSLQFACATKRPFGFEFTATFGGTTARYQMVATATEVRWKRVL